MRIVLRLLPCVLAACVGAAETVDYPKGPSDPTTTPRDVAAVGQDPIAILCVAGHFALVPQRQNGDVKPPIWEDARFRATILENLQRVAEESKKLPTVDRARRDAATERLRRITQAWAPVAKARSQEPDGKRLGAIIMDIMNRVGSVPAAEITAPQAPPVLPDDAAGYDPRTQGR